jgi:hypothetical protein
MDALSAHRFRRKSAICKHVTRQTEQHLSDGEQKNFRVAAVKSGNEPSQQPSSDNSIHLFLLSLLNVHYGSPDATIRSLYCSQWEIHSREKNSEFFDVTLAVRGKRRHMLATIRARIHAIPFHAQSHVYSVSCRAF